MDMKNKYKGGYDLIMEHISVTPEMEARIMSNLRKEGEKRSRIKARAYMRWAAGVAACVAIGILCLSVVPMLQNQPQEPVDSVSAPLPPENYNTPAEAKSALSFDAYTPNALPDGYALDSCTVYDAGKMLELTYSSSDNEISYRTAEGSDDISGDYTEYAKEDTVTADGGASVLLKGDESGWQTAGWTAAGRTYCIYSIQPLSENDMLTIVNSVQSSLD